MSSNTRCDNLGYWCDGPVVDNPNAIAIIDLSEGERVVSYGDLDRQMNRFANWTCKVGLTPGDRMAIVVGNRYEFIIAMYGAMRAGIVPVPISTKVGSKILHHILTDSDCKAAVVDKVASIFAVAACEEVISGSLLALGTPIEGWTDFHDAIGGLPTEYEPPRLVSGHPAFQPYTSGSTGFPKGVVLTHEGQLWWIRTLQKYWPYSVDRRALAAVPLYHKNAMAGAIKPVLHVGGTVVLLPNFDSRRFLLALSKYRCTNAGAVPTVFTMLLQQTDLIETLDFSALEGFSIGSAPVQEKLLDRVQTAFKCQVSESYGLTEGGPVMIGQPVDGRPVPNGSCGVAWPEGELKLVDASGVEHDSLGELWVRNPGVTPGYHNLPEVNESRLIDGWLATGDIMHRDNDGFYFFRGRVDDMFNSGGENIYPKEVENLLISHPEIYDACVVPLYDPLKGAVPVAMVLIKPGSQLAEDEIKAFALAGGPGFAHPRRVLMVEQMPLNSADKVDRKAIENELTECFADYIAQRRQDNPLTQREVLT